MNKALLHIIDFAMRLTSTRFHIESTTSSSRSRDKGTEPGDRGEIPTPISFLHSRSKLEILEFIKNLSFNDALNLLQNSDPETRLKILDALNDLPDLKTALELCSNEKLINSGPDLGLRAG